MSITLTESGLSTKEQFIEAYVARDEELQLNKKKLIENGLVKLGYTTTHIQLKKNQYIHDCVCKHIQNTIDIISGIQIDEFVKKLQESEAYKTFEHNLHEEHRRTLELSIFIGSSDNRAFYEALTLDELRYLGY